MDNHCKGQHPSIVAKWLLYGKFPINPIYENLLEYFRDPTIELIIKAEGSKIN